jgi:hypothetical protein
MRENRLYSSEGGARSNPSFLPLSERVCRGDKIAADACGRADESKPTDLWLAHVRVAFGAHTRAP